MSDSPAAAPRHLPLHKLHRRWNARWQVVDGLELPADYGSSADEYRALKEGCGLLDRSDVARLELMGEDRHRFLNGLVTCEVKALGTGEGAYGYFTDRQGKILADVVVLALEDRLWLELPASAGDAIRAQLEKYIIADRVEVKPLDDLALWALAGPGSRELLAGLAPEPLPETPWSHRKLMLAGSEVQLVRQARLGIDAFTVWCSASLGRPLAESLLEASSSRGLRPAGRGALETIRVESGIAKFGDDFGPANFPQEVGEDGTVSYTKGCYLGQEIVARIHYRGGVNHRLFELAFAAPGVTAGAPLWLEDREVGAVTSATSSPSAGEVGIAMVHKRGWEARAFEVVIAGSRAPATRRG
jgi:folate-binding protein YgfZ